VDEANEHHIELFESREDASKALLPTKQPLDLIAPLVHLAVVLPSSEAIALGRDDRNEVQIKG
jgi:hypothetical protein